jgi:hypothetical protein
MKIYHRLLAILLCAALALGAAPAASAEPTVPALYAVSAGAPCGKTVSIEIRLTGGANLVCGGWLDIKYDPTVLTVQSSAADAALSGFMTNVNPKHADDTIRFNFAGNVALTSDCTLCTIVFQISESASPGDYSVDLSNSKLYDLNGSPVAHSKSSGSVTVQYIRLSVGMEQGVPSQSIRVPVTLGGDLSAAGGSFEVIYDPGKMTAGEAAPGSILQGYRFYCKEDNEKGILKVTWAGTDLLALRGTLCSLTFGISAGAADSLPLRIQNVRVYDAGGVSIAALADDGSVSLVLPTEKNPKLWVVGGALQSDGSVDVSIVLEGRGRVCGGSFTFRYDAASCTLLSVVSEAAEIGAISAVNSPLAEESSRTSAGTIKFSWSGAAPSVGSQCLLKLKLHAVAAGGSLMLGSASLIDEDGAAVTPVDIRSGAVQSADCTLQTPQKDALTVERGSAGSTSVGLSIDVASAASGDDIGTESCQLIVVFKADGKLTKTVIPGISPIVFDKNGLGKLSLTANCSEADTVQVLFLRPDGSFVPCTQMLNCTIS